MHYSTGTDITASTEALRPGPAAAPWWRSLRLAVSFPAMMAVLLMAIALIGAEDRLLDPDTWWHITVGQEILKTHTWPTSDIYSFTARGAHWIEYEWLGDVFMALAAKGGTLVGLAWLQKTLVVLLTLLLYLHAYLVCRNSKAACVAAALLLPIAPVAFRLRPQLFGYIFLLLAMICLQLFENGHERALYFLPPLFVVWVNTHGTFMFGLLVIGICWITGFVSFRVGGLFGKQLPTGRRVKLLLAFLFCLLALLITPYGSQLAANPLDLAMAQPLNIANIQEWQPLSLANPMGAYILVFVTALFLATVMLRLSYSIAEMALLLFSMYAALAHLRFTMIFILFCVPIVANILARWTPIYEPAKDKYLLNFVIMTLVVLSLIKFRPSESALEAVVAADYPEEALHYVRAHPHPTGLFNEYGWGGYLISQLGPSQAVFIDGRGDLYEHSGVLADYLEAASGQVDALRILASHNISSCLINRSSALAGLLVKSPGWKLVYSDGLAEIFDRTDRAWPRGGP
jgi:hypothetical protein